MEHIFFILSLLVSLIIIRSQFASAQHEKQHRSQCQASKNPSIEKACANALYKELCVQSLKSVPTSESCDIKTLALNSINITKIHGSNVSSWLEEKLKDSDLSPHIKFALSECSDHYTYALEDLKRNIDSISTVKTFNHHFFHDLTTFVSGAMVSAINCEDVMKEFKGKDMMGNKNKLFQQHCSNALNVIIFWSRNHLD